MKGEKKRKAGKSLTQNEIWHKQSSKSSAFALQNLSRCLSKAAVHMFCHTKIKNAGVWL